MVRYWAPAPRGSSTVPTRVVSTSVGMVALINGKAEISVETGPLVIQYIPMGNTTGGTRFNVTIPKGETPIDLRPLLVGAIEHSQEAFAISESSSVETFLEVATIYPNFVAPVGPKPMVIAEVSGQPGVLTEIWCALQSENESRDGPMEDGTIIRIFLDDRLNPTVEMPIADFFMYSARSKEFTTERVARVAHHGFRSGAYRNVWAPFNGYMRVEFENQTVSDLIAYGSASYKHGVNSVGQRFAIASVNKKDALPLSEVVIADVEGNGQVESITLAVSSTLTDDYGPLEGNFRVEVDGKKVSVSSGTEDFFRGAWYALPIGGYPIGRAGISTLPGSHICLYRFFPETAIRFRDSLKVVFPVGQQGQGIMKATEYHVAGSVSYWLLDDLPEPNPKIPDYANPVIDHDFTGPDVEELMDLWGRDPLKRAPIPTPRGIMFHSGTEDEPDVSDQRMWVRNLTIPDEWWMETEMIWNTAPEGSDAGLVFRGGTDIYPDPMFATACHFTMDAIANNGFRLRPRDQWDGPFVSTYPNGSPIGVKIKLAVRYMDGVITTYYRAPGQDFWSPINSWVPTTSGPSVGLYSWRAGVTFSRFALYPLRDGML